MSEILKAIENWFNEDLYKAIESNFDRSGKPSTIWGGGGIKLLLKSGKLLNSWLGGSNSITKTSITSDKVIFERYTTLPYARLHEYGGIRPITPAMRKYFWSIYFRFKGTELGEAGKMAALFANFIRYPARPFLSNAVSQAINKLREKLNVSVRYEIIKDFDNAKSDFKYS